MSDSLTHSAAAATAPRPGPGRRLVVHGLGLAVFAAMPLIAAAVGDPFVVSLITDRHTRRLAVQTFNRGVQLQVRGI